MVSAALTFNLLFGPSGVAGGSRHAHIVPVDVLQKHLSVPPGQSARLEHGVVVHIRTNSHDSDTL